MTINRYLLLVAAVFSAIACLAGSAGGRAGDVAEFVEVPKGMGYCVTINDTEGNLLGVTEVPFHRADQAKIEEYRTSVRNAAMLHVEGVKRVVFVKDIGTAVTEATKKKQRRIKGTMYCSCTNTNRDANNKFVSCSGPCGSCTYCVVTG